MDHHGSSSFSLSQIHRFSKIVVYFHLRPNNTAVASISGSQRMGMRVRALCCYDSVVHQICPHWQKSWPLLRCFLGSVAFVDWLGILTRVFYHYWYLHFYREIPSEFKEWQQEVLGLPEAKGHRIRTIAKRFSRRSVIFSYAIIFIVFSHSDRQLNIFFKDSYSHFEYSTTRAAFFGKV